MKMRVRLVLIFLLTLVLPLMVTNVARAEERSTFALVVTNNRSARLARPDLRYADDDGAKYFEMFRMLAPPSNVVLLTTFDPDTRKLFPELAGNVRPPSVENVKAAARAMAAQIEAAKASGPVDFYFVFAGHGDIDHGRGFLELEDGPLTADGLQDLIRSMPATRSHVILDSCNAFFAIQARKPGGRHFLTSDEAQRSLAERLPDVGVFLSTSAEGSVFEWSSIQSGIFSHAVRSGISGAADADGDGHVTYDELRAFVDIASRDVKNPVYRPQVFARGPGGQGTADLVDLSRAKGKRLLLDEGARRLTIRDEADIPWVDVNKEAGRTASLVFPQRLGRNGVVEEDAPAGRTRRTFDVEGSDAIALADLTELASPVDARGSDEVFRSLFAQPFGPRAYAAFLAEQKDAPPLVLGVSPDEKERLRLLLRETADSAQRARFLRGAMAMSVSLGFGAASGVKLAEGIRNDDTSSIVLSSVGVGVGALATGFDLYWMLRPSYEERTYADFSTSLALTSDPTREQAAFADAERRLFIAERKDHRMRVVNRWLGLAVAAGYGFILGRSIAGVEGDLSRVDPVMTGLGATMGLFSAVLFVDSFFPTTTERMAKLWREDPELLRTARTSSLTLKPVFGGLSVGLVGTF